jgi:hypothetical protein
MRPPIRFQIAFSAWALLFASLGVPRGAALAQSPPPAASATVPEEIPAGDAGPYQTMCVRACDGFYFPLRQNARRENFAGDDKVCRSSCGSQARLFYFPLNGGKPATMVDQEGRKYADESQAFAFRKAIISGCACRPAPWSEEAAARHRSYAAAAVERRLRTEQLHVEDEQAISAKASAAISAAAERAYYGPDADAPGSRPAASSLVSAATSDGNGIQAIAPSSQRPTFRMPALRYDGW